MEPQPEHGVFDTVFCRSLVISASDGVPRIQLHTDEDGNATIILLDMHGHVRITASVAANGNATLSLADHNDAIRLIAATDRKGVTVTLHDANSEQQGGWAVPNTPPSEEPNARRTTRRTNEGGNEY